MGSYKVSFSRRAQKELEKIDKRYIPLVIEVVEGLASEPKPVSSKKLEGTDSTYRIRIGDYRVIYEVSDQRLLVVAIRVRHRQSAYD